MNVRVNEKFGQLSLKDLKSPLELFRNARSAVEEEAFKVFFVDDVEDLSFGRNKKADIIGFNVFDLHIIIVGVPQRRKVKPIDPRCYTVDSSLEAYLTAITLHEFMENITRDRRHCHNPSLCLNSNCKYYEEGTCCVCMGTKIEESLKNRKMKAEDLFCDCHFRALQNEL